MSLTATSIVPILATPFAVVPLPDLQALNPAIEASIDSRMQKAVPSSSDPFCYRSAEDFFEEPDPIVAELSRGMLRGVCEVVAAVNLFSDAQLRELRIESRGSFTVVLPNGQVPVANHALTAWCAVYCVAGPPASRTRVDSGILRLYESRFSTTFQDASNAAMRLPYRTGHYGWRPVAGQMAVFPASLPYEIAPLRAEGRLVFVSARVRFVANGQPGMGRW